MNDIWVVIIVTHGLALNVALFCHVLTDFHFSLGESRCLRSLITAPDTTLVHQRTRNGAQARRARLGYKNIPRRMQAGVQPYREISRINQ